MPAYTSSSRPRPHRPSMSSRFNIFHRFGTAQRSQNDNPSSSSSETPTNPHATSPVFDIDAAEFIRALEENSHLPVLSPPTTPPPMLVSVHDSQPPRPPSTPPPMLVNVQDSQPASSPPLSRAETPPPLLVSATEPLNVSIFNDNYFGNYWRMEPAVSSSSGSGGGVALGTSAAASSDAERRRRREHLGGGGTDWHGDLAFRQSVERTAEAFQSIAITVEEMEATAAAAAAASSARQGSETRARHHYRSYQSDIGLNLPFTSAAGASRGVTRGAPGLWGDRERAEDEEDDTDEEDEDDTDEEDDADEEDDTDEEDEEHQQDRGAQPAADTRPSRVAEAGRVRSRGRFGHVGNGITAVDKTELQEKGSIGCDICFERWHWATPEDVERVAPEKSTMFGNEATGEEDEAAAAAKVCEEPRKLPCGHIFGKECLTDWLARKDTCPACRHKVAPGIPSPYVIGLEMLRVIYNDKRRNNKDEWEEALQIFRGSPAFLNEGFTY